MSEHPHMSIISPVYGAEKILRPLVERLVASVSKITEDFEVILVEDASPDNSWRGIAEACANDPRIKGVRLSRNFGQQPALAAGFDLARGDWVVTLDCDLQDQPEEIEKLYQKAQEGFDIVLASREDRQDGFLKKLFSRLFYKVLGYLTETPQDASVANFTLCKREVIDALRKMGDYYKYFPTQIRWVGFHVAKVPVAHAQRVEGGSSYNFRKRIGLALNTIISFSDKPIRLTVKLGVLISGLVSIGGVVTVIVYLMGDLDQPGWASVFLSVWFALGILISVLGMIGLYLGKAFETVKTRPVYIIAEQLNEETCDE